MFATADTSHHYRLIYVLSTHVGRLCIESRGTLDSNQQTSWRTHGNQSGATRRSRWWGGGASLAATAPSSEHTESKDNQMPEKVSACLFNCNVVFGISVLVLFTEHCVKHHWSSAQMKPSHRLMSSEATHWKLWMSSLHAISVLIVNTIDNMHHTLPNRSSSFVKTKDKEDYMSLSSVRKSIMHHHDSSSPVHLQQPVCYI